MLVFGAALCLWNFLQTADLDARCTRANRSLDPDSAFPVAVDPGRVGSYPAVSNSGAGYFYDDVLEYRVWFSTDTGDRYQAFAQWEPADAFSRSRSGAEPALALVRQLEHIDEPRPGVYAAVVGERFTEWRVEWLKGAHRGPTSIADFLQHPRAMRTAEAAPDER